MTFEFKATRTWPFQVAGGGAIYRPTVGGREYLLLHRAPRDPGLGETWHLPKGTLHRGETLEQCAARESAEETGRNVELEGYLGALQSRWTDERGRLIDKTVHYFLCRDAGAASGDMDAEHDRVDERVPKSVDSSSGSL